MKLFAESSGLSRTWSMRELQTQRVENLIATWFPTPTGKMFMGLLALCGQSLLLGVGLPEWKRLSSLRTSLFPLCMLGKKKSADDILKYFSDFS